MNRRPLLPAALALVLLAAVFAPPAAAQQAHSQDQSRAATSTAQRENLPGNLPEFAPTDLPTPNQYRAASGRPGPAYWQNAADYDIDVTLDPDAERISGTVTIHYTNNAPQTLDYLWLQLDQNLFKEGSRGSQLYSDKARFSGSFAGGGYDIDDMHIRQGGRTYTPAYTVDGTKMRVTLADGLAEDGGSLALSIDYSFKIPKYGADRMGQYDADAGTIFEIAQWYPRMYTFDDVNGWNALPYLGQGEFYLEYGSFDVNVTVPHDLIVTGTGTLQNPRQVLTATERRRLDRARSSDQTVTIVGQDEVGDASTRPGGSGPLTWKFHADDVRDFSWAASKAFIWDAAATHGEGPTLAQSYYPEEGIGTGGEVGWEQSTQMVQHTIEHYSGMWAGYPYPSAINVAGIVAGMEYPQIVFCSVDSRGKRLYGVTTHELGHEWFPMLVGSDERRHAWMDEGLNTFINHYSELSYYKDEVPSQKRARLSQYLGKVASRHAVDRPISTYADRIPNRQLGVLAYNKPAEGLILLREYILGKDVFDSAFKEYIDRWEYKHPQPADFFRTIEGVSGEDLDWFWNGWFRSNDEIDQAITDVSTQNDTSRVTVAQQQDLIMPLELRAQMSDGSTVTRRLPVEAFFSKDTYTAIFPGNVERVRLDPRGYLPDVDPSDNLWSRDRGVHAPATMQSSGQR